MKVPLRLAGILLFLVSAACFAAAQQPSPTGASMSDRDKAGLRGSVKTLVEEETFSGAGGQQFHTTSTTRFAPDGRILEERHGYSDGSEFVISYIYRSDGRLQKTVSGNTNSAVRSENTYLYDDAQRLVGVKSGDKIQLRYQYDDKGRKSATESYESRPLPGKTAYVPHWEGTDLGFPTDAGGTLTTAYNEEGVATGAEFRDADGKLLGHIVRKFDDKGRITSEEQFADAPLEPAEIRSQLNPEQLKTVGMLVAGLANRTNSYAYDDQGRVTERHRSGGPFGDEVTITKYNENGDKASERTTTVMNPDVGREFGITEAGTMIPTGPPKPAEPPTTYETQYTYDYDSNGNWTKLTTAGRSNPDGVFEPNQVRHRKLTYY